MKIGLDLDGTLYQHPEFFAAMIEAMYAEDHDFYCISGHGRDEWEKDCERLKEMGIDADKISPELMNPVRHESMKIKGAAMDQCDFCFDDDSRMQKYTKTPVFWSPVNGRYNYDANL